MRAGPSSSRLRCASLFESLVSTCAASASTLPEYDLRIMPRVHATCPCSGVLIALAEALDLDVLIGILMMPFISIMQYFAAKFDNHALDPQVWSPPPHNIASHRTASPPIFTLPNLHTSDLHASDLHASDLHTSDLHTSHRFGCPMPRARTSACAGATRACSCRPTFQSSSCS